MANNSKKAATKKGAKETEETKKQVAEQPITETPAAPVAEQPTETTEQKAAREQREATLAEAKKLVGHKAEYVPAEDYEFHPAVVVGAVIDNKGNVLVALRTEDGKRVTKKFGSKLLRVSEEMAPQSVRTRSKKERTAITQEVIDQHRELVGFPCKLDSMDGRVRGVQVDKRTAQIYLTIHLVDGTKRHTKIDNKNLEMMEADSETEEIRNAYTELLAQRAAGKKSSPANQIQAHGAGFVKAYKALIEAGKIEETENLIAIIEEICETAKTIKDEPTSEAPAED